MTLVHEPDLTDIDDPGMRAVLAGAYESTDERSPKLLDLNHKALVKDRMAWRRADQEAKERLATEPLSGDSDEKRSGWRPVDLTPVLNGTAEVVLPEIGRREDGMRLLYRGKEHSIASEPECGKTWFALMQVVDVLKSSGTVVYVDFEDDERTIVGRLRTMGLLASRLTSEANQFRYSRPEGPHQMDWLLELLDFDNGRRADLVIYDGVTEGMQLWGLDPLNQNAAAEWRRLLIKPAMSVGAAALSTDHVVKNREARGGYAIGAQHKLAGLNGAQFLMERVDPFGRGMKGRSKVLVSKDRNGGLRQYGQAVEGQPGITYIGDLVGDATSGEMDSLRFWPPREPDDQAVDEEAQDPPKVDLSKVLRQIRSILAGREKPQSFNDINSRANFSASKVRQALAQMEDDGEIVVEEGPNRSRLHSLTPGVELSEAA